MDITPHQIADDLRGRFRGRLALDDWSRRLYATDASLFEVVPLGVAVPVDAEDLSELVRYCHEHAVPLAPRGAGTGVAGESLSPGLIVDLSVEFRSIVDVRSDRVTVEPGVVLAELNAVLARSGRRFAPNPASAATCTLGGMIATNASGGNAFRHGYTRDYVLGLDVVWDSGDTDTLTHGPMPASVPHARTAIICRELQDLLANNRDAMTRSITKTMYDRCGYHLGGLIAEPGPDLTQLLVGSEGTLGFITQATLKTIPLAGGTAVALLGFPTLEAAVRAGLDLRTFHPVGCDLLDKRLLSLTRHSHVSPRSGMIPPAVGAALVVVFEGQTEREAVELAWGAVEQLRRSHVLLLLGEPTTSPEGTARIRGIRDSAVAGLYALGKGPRPVAFIEDVGVPADALLEYLTRAQDILQQHELTASFLVHALTGQVHTRPLVDLDDPSDRAKLWPVAEVIHQLALALGGTVTTQHGTGIARTPWVERQVGPLMPLYRELKRIFDPKNILNPGKLVGPDPGRPAWPLRQARGRADASQLADRAESSSAVELSKPLTSPRTPILQWRDSSPEEEAARCTGCGDCRPRTGPDRMCPVFRATGLEAATPRAKANLIRALAHPEELAADAVSEIARLCVNCKMCRDECHSRVDVPKMMLEAKAVHHAERGLDRDDWVLARTESFAALGSHFAPLVNGMLARRSIRWILEKVFGVSRRRRLPAFALRNFFRHARGAGWTNKRRSTPDRDPAVASDPRPTRIALFVDVFPAYNDPLIAVAAVDVLRHNGMEVHVPLNQVGCGMAPLAMGDVETAREMAIRNVRIFANLVREGYQVVCLEPTAAVMLTQDYLDLLDEPDAGVVAANTTEITAFLWERHRLGRLNTRFRTLTLTLGHHVPCHLKALRGPIAGPELLALIPGLRVHPIDVSCSGMAGPWGLKAKNYEPSLAAGQPMLAELDRPGVMFGSTECSTCRMQMQEGTGKRTLHPVQYLALAYGLGPAIDAKLRKPLSELVSD